MVNVGDYAKITDQRRISLRRLKAAGGAWRQDLPLDRLKKTVTRFPYSRTDPENLGLKALYWLPNLSLGW
jgi:hypothetical protein